MIGGNQDRMQPNNRFDKECFFAGYYYRLSDEDRDKADRMQESRSISTQRDMIHYAVSQGLIRGVRFYREYFDDDYTGLNFDRPAFQEMMRDVKQRNIDCIIVKDFSRFGRDSERIKRFLEVDFEQKGQEVRFIAFGDGYDSLYKTPDMGVRMLLFMNEEYSQNQHLKVSLAIRTKQAKGMFIGAFPRYGYRRDPEDRHHLVPDPEAFEVVQRIFRMAYYENMGASQIAQRLTQEGVDPPSVYKEKQGCAYRCGRCLGTKGLWSPDTVYSMLRDETYTGAVVQGRRRKDTLLGMAKAVAPSEYVVVPGMHEPAVSKEVFDALSAGRKGRGSRITRGRGLFQGVLRCGDCGHALVKRSETYRGRVYVSYCCRIHKQVSAQCYPNHISEKVLKQVVREDINRILSGLNAPGGAVDKCRDGALSGERGRRMLQAMRREMNRVRELEGLLDGVERKWLLGKLEDGRHEELSSRYQRELADARIRVKDLEERLGRMGDPSCVPWVARLLDEGVLEDLTREMVSGLIDTVYLNHDREVRIVYRFQKP